MGKNQKPANGFALDFDVQLWAAAEQAVPAPHLTKTEYNGACPEGVCLGLIFLKYISDAFEEKREQLLFGFSDANSEWFSKDADLHPDLKADLVLVWKDLANPPFNMSDRGGENLGQDVRWKFGMPPVNNANYTWIQHVIHHLSPVGVAGFVMANGSMSTQTSNQGEIRKALIEADLANAIANN